MQHLKRTPWLAGVLALIGCAEGDQQPLAEGQSRLAGRPAIEEIRRFASCDECAIGPITRLNLPESGVEAYSAKVLEPGGGVITLLADGTPASEKALLEDEAAIHAARYGKSSKALHALASRVSPETMLPIAIWARVHIDHPQKEALLADPARMAAHRAATLDAVRAGTVPVLSWLRAHDAVIDEDGSESPMILAELRAGDVARLSYVHEVAFVDSAPELHPEGYDAWFTTVRANDALLLSTGSGVNLCNGVAKQPTDYTNLTVALPGDVAVPAGGTATHDLATTAILRNNAAAGRTMTTASRILVSNWDDFTVNPNWVGWCWSHGALGMNFSYGGSNTPGGPSVLDYKLDYYTKQYPYALTVASSGDSTTAGSDTVSQNAARGFNYLVAGGSDDKQTASISDDTFWDTGTGYGSSWRNPTSTHSDREMPHVVAPASGADMAISGLAGSFGGTSASAPMVAGTVGLVVARDTSTFTGWPEMIRAVVIASSVHIVDGSQITSLPSGDTKQGAGLLNAKFAAQLAAPANYAAPASAARSSGRYRKTLVFSSDFDASGNSVDVYNLKADVTGRLRTVIAWDSTATCNSTGDSCTADALDADLDLWIYNAAGALVCSSSTYDNSWEMCDISVTAGQTYTARLHKYSTTTATTYMGIAWMNYDHAND